MTRTTQDAAVRPELPPMTARIAKLPVHRGYPVPWFVAWLDDNGQQTGRRGEGTPDFRIIFDSPEGSAVEVAHTDSLCWVCGEPVGAFKAFTIGPMCAINRISAEPPSHYDCANWSVRSCPFLTRPDMRRRDHDLPDGSVHAPGDMIMRNPGAGLIWVTKSYKLVPVPGGGTLFKVGDPERVEWYCRGREATYAEVMESIRTGLPILAKSAMEEGSHAVVMLEQQVQAAMELLPDRGEPCVYRVNVSYGDDTARVYGVEAYWKGEAEARAKLFAVDMIKVEAFDDYESFGDVDGVVHDVLPLPGRDEAGNKET